MVFVTQMRAAAAPKAARASWAPHFVLRNSLNETGPEKSAINERLIRSIPANDSIYDANALFSLAKQRYLATENKMSARNQAVKDKFAAFGCNPLELWKAPEELNNYITQNGRIIPGYIHGHKGSTQRKLAKAIRRCRAAGLLSTVHRSVFASK